VTLLSVNFVQINEVQEIEMTRRIMSILWAKIAFFILFAAVTSAASIAQTDVEIEIAGPWSYVQDPADASRVIIVAPDVGHIMAVFKGDDAFDYLGATPAKPALGSHRLDFVTVSCGSASAHSSYFLYPANGVTVQNIASVLTSTSAYSLSLPKPCSYENGLESRFKYHGVKPVAVGDPERSLTTWMILHYKVNVTTTGADLDKGTANASNTPFGSNSGSTKKAISVILYLDNSIPPDTNCDSHSATAFDSTLALWNLPHVYHLFPQLKDLINSNQQLATYSYSCVQTYNSSSKAMPNNNHAKVTLSAKRSITEKLKPMAPGRADCHAAQVNVNGVVN
jgi:hypothetical protein